MKEGEGIGGRRIKLFGEGWVELRKGKPKNEKN